jgi:hypothetical protein
VNPSHAKRVRVLPNDRREPRSRHPARCFLSPMPTSRPRFPPSPFGRLPRMQKWRTLVLALACAAGSAAAQEKFGNRALQDFLHTRGAEGVRARAGDAAFLRLPRDAEGVLGDSAERPEVRHRLLGRGGEPAPGPSHRPVAGGDAAAGAGGGGAGRGDRREDDPRERTGSPRSRRSTRISKSVDQDTRSRNYEKAMAALVRKYPDDVEARVFPRAGAERDLRRQGRQAGAWPRSRACSRSSGAIATIPASSTT